MTSAMDLWLRSFAVNGATMKTLGASVKFPRVSVGLKLAKEMCYRDPSMN